MAANRKRRMASSASAESSTPSNPNAAASDAPRWADHAQDRQRHGGFAAAGLAGQPQRLAGRQAEADAAHRTHQPERMRERHKQIANFQHCGADADFLSRGLAISSSPAVTRNNPRNTTTMMAIGGTHHHQPTKMYPMPTNSPNASRRTMPTNRMARTERHGVNRP